MQPETIRHDWRNSGLLERLPRRWRLPLARLSLAWLAIFALTLRDWAAMADQWWNISTYNHILFVPPIIGWLVWLRRFELAKLTPSAWWPGLFLLAGGLMLWLLGTLSGVNTASQLGAVVALQAAVLTVLGMRIAAALLFPLAYSLFLVPFGDELVPALQMITAELTIGLTHLSGVPATVDGVFIDTPVGLFEVAEACSGVKFLIAMMALGVLVAHSCFAGWKRRTVFMAVALLVPILANGARAWGTIYIAQSQGIEFAEGFDHIFYGWVFFGLVIVAVLGISWRWFDREPDEVPISAEAIEASSLLDRVSAWSTGPNTALVLSAGLVVAFGLWSTAAHRVEADIADRLTIPPVEGWQQVASPMEVEWRPRANGADRRIAVRYADADGRIVDVFLALYALQDDARDATAVNEGALPPDTAWRWLAPGPHGEDARGDYLFAYGEVKRLAETSYRTGSLTTASASRLKLAVMRDRALLLPEPAMMLIVSAEGSDNRELAQRLGDFTDAMGDRGRWMDRAARLR